MKPLFAGLLAAVCFAVLFLASLVPVRWFSRALSGRSQRRRCNYAGRPPFADAAWAGKENDKSRFPICEWCAGTGHPHGDEGYGLCECPALAQNKEGHR